MFEVSTGALRAFSQDIDELATSSGASGRARTYVRDHLTLTFVDTAVVYAAAVERSDELREALRQLFETQTTALTATATELRATADSYDASDDAANARLDATLPDVCYASPPVVPWSRGVYVLPTPVLDELTSPVHVPERDLVGSILTTDWFSPTSLVMELIELIFKYHPVDEVVKTFSGNWAAMYTCASALGALADYEAQVGSHVSTGASICMDDWSGEAAAAAGAYFSSLSATCRANAEAIRATAPAYEQVAQGMEGLASVLSGLYMQIMDLTVASAILYAIGAATAETVIGGIVGVLGGSASLLYAIVLANDAWQVIQDAWTVLDIFTSAVATGASFGMGDLTITMPRAYDNQLVP